MLTHILLGVMHFWEIKGDFYHLQAASQCPSQYSTPHNTAGKYHFETLHHSVQRIQLSHSEWLSSTFFLQTSCQFQNVNKCLIPTNMTKAIRNMSRGKVPSLHIRRWRINNVVLILNLSQSNKIGRNFVNLLVLMPSFMDDYRANGDFWGRSKGRSEEEEDWIEERKNKFFGRIEGDWRKRNKWYLLNKEMWKKVSLKRKRTGRTR